MKFEIRVLVVAAIAVTASAQGTLGDYQRGQAMQAKARALVVNVPGAANWIGDSERFWYSRSVKGGTEFLLVDAREAVKKPAFDHEKLAAAINAGSGGHYTALALPFAPVAGGRGAAAAVAPALTFADDGQ